MNYLMKKYDGYIMIDTVFLQDELLLTSVEYQAIKQDVAHTLGKKRCPYQLDLEMFCNIVERYL